MAALTPRDGLALAGAALAALALAAAAVVALGGSVDPGGAPGTGAGASLDPFASVAPSPAAAPSGPSELLVDVQGAVARPGLVRLAAGARVADAIAAAGGYTKQTDLLAAAGQINLAAALADGAQVFVPIRGVAVGGSGSGGSGAGGGTGSGGAGSLVNLNTATADELEALPGIGPVTVEKILAARQERPFATLEELVERDVMHSGQLEDIRDLVTL
jgi:competence protein ComEA